MDFYGMYGEIFERSKKAEALARVIESQIERFPTEPHQVDDMEAIQYLMYTLTEQVEALTGQLKAMEEARTKES